MVLRHDAVLLEHCLPKSVHAVGFLTPLLGRQIAVFEYFSGGRVAPHLGDDDYVLAADGCGQLGDVLDLIPDGIPGIVLVQVFENGTGRKLQAAGAEFVRQLGWIGRKVSERAEFDPFVSRRGYLVEESCVRGLLWIVRKPHTPGVGG